jgi:transcriptional regulator with XRE-family HTH domain
MSSSQQHDSSNVGTIGTKGYIKKSRTPTGRTAAGGPEMTELYSQMPTAVFVAKESISNRKYTPSGIERLSLAIKATVFHKGYSQRQLAELANVSHVTINKYIRGNIYAPDQAIIRAIAPFICKVLTIRKDGVEIDPDHTYGEDWHALDKLATDEYEDLLPSQ